MNTCPDCNGKGTKTVYACPGFRRMEIKCDRCRGTGKINDEQLAWIEAGQRCKARRKAAKLVLGQVAQRFGMSPAMVSSIERGICDPAPLVKAWEEQG